MFKEVVGKARHEVWPGKQMRNRILVQTRQKQKCATFVRNISKPRYTLVKRDRGLPAFPQILAPDVMQSGFGVKFLFWSGELSFPETPQKRERKMVAIAICDMGALSSRPGAWAPRIRESSPAVRVKSLASPFC